MTAGPRVSPPPDRALLQREAIIDAARDIIVERGVGALTLRVLAQRIGVTAPALYAHVRDKDDILRAVVDVELDRLADRFETVADAEPIERIRAHGRAYVEYAVGQPGAVPGDAARPTGRSPRERAASSGDPGVRHGRRRSR